MCINTFLRNFMVTCFISKKENYFNDLWNFNHKHVYILNFTLFFLIILTLFLLITPGKNTLKLIYEISESEISVAVIVFLKHRIHLHYHHYGLHQMHLLLSSFPCCISSLFCITLTLDQPSSYWWLITQVWNHNTS